MRQLRIFLTVALLPLFLAACQTAEFSTTNFAPNELRSGPVKTRAKLTTQKPKRVARSTQTKRKGLPPNEMRSLVVKPKRVAIARQNDTIIRRNAAKSSKKKTKTATVVRGKGGKYSTRKARYRKLIAKHARANGVPVRLAMAVVHVESSYRSNARGAAGEIGLMQIMPRTARFIGYKGPMRKLYNPDTNLRYGMKYLGKAYRLGGRTSCGAILKYNAGHGAKRWNPISRRYCNRVRRLMRSGAV